MGRSIDFLFHLTDSARLPSIARVGLDPVRSREPAWRERSVYLSADALHCMAYSDHHGDWVGPPVLLRVAVARLDARFLHADDVDLPELLAQRGRSGEPVDWRKSLLISGQCRSTQVIAPQILQWRDDAANVFRPLAEHLSYVPRPAPRQRR